MLPLRLRRTLVATAVPLAILAIAWIDLSGCTAVGFAIGAASDHAEGMGPSSRLLEVKNGGLVTLWLLGGRKLEGQLMGVTLADSSDSLRVTGAGLPAGSRIHMKVGEGERMGLVGPDRVYDVSVPADSVVSVLVPIARGKVIGLLSGLAVDGIIVYSAAQSADDAFGCSDLDLSGLGGSY